MSAPGSAHPEEQVIDPRRLHQLTCRVGQPRDSQSAFCETWRNDLLRLCSGSASEQGRRWSQEDRHVSFANLTPAGAPEDLAFFAVYDGHGGHDVSQILSEKLHLMILDAQSGSTPTHSVAGEELRKSQSGVFDATGAECAVTEACIQIDDEICKAQMQAIDAAISAENRDLMRKASAQANTPGATAAFAMFWMQHDNTVQMLVGNVGDCRATICTDGEASALTRDHKPLRDVNRDELSRVKAQGAIVYEGRLNGVLAVSRAFGDAPHKQGEQQRGQLIAKPAICVRQLEPGDEFLILACDGIWDVMMDQQAVDFVRAQLHKHRDVDVAAKALVRKCIEMGSIDNCSAVIIGLNQAQAARTGNGIGCCTLQ